MMDLIPGPNLVVGTPPSGDSTNRPASTQFVTQAIAAATAALPVGVSTSQLDFLSGGVSAPANQDYRIVEFVPFAMTLTNFAAKLSTGLLTAYLSINAATVTGSTLNLGTTQITTAPSGLNTAALGSTIILTISSVANSAANLSFTVQFNRNFSTG
jgi:hypothetical protein